MNLKDDRNFQNKLNSGDSLDTTVMGNCVLLVLAREFIIEDLLMRKESFIEWFHENSDKFEVVEEYAVKSINLVDLFNKRAQEEPLKEFFEQFRQLILDKQRAYPLRILPMR